KSPNRLRNCHQETREHGTYEIAQSAEHNHHERNKDEKRADVRNDVVDRHHERSCDAETGDAYAECQRIDSVDVDAHEFGRPAIRCRGADHPSELGELELTIQSESD